MSKALSTAAAIAAFVLAQPDDALAQGGALARRLETAERIDCRFTALATGTWGDDGPTATVQPAELEAAFHGIDIDEGTAEADGRFGASFIVVRYAHGYLHFMQMSDTGPLYLTTVLAEESRDGRLKAVHTRHEHTATALPGFTSRPEMYVGDCAVTG